MQCYHRAHPVSRIGTAPSEQQAARISWVARSLFSSYDSYRVTYRTALTQALARGSKLPVSLGTGGPFLDLGTSKGKVDERLGTCVTTTPRGIECVHKSGPDECLQEQKQVGRTRLQSERDCTMVNT